jgi:hypothetical protein
VLPQVMRLRRGVLQNPPKSSVLSRLPFYKNRPLRTRSESTLLQLLIPLHFNFPRINTYKKPGRGYPPSSPKVLQLFTTPTSSYRSLSTVSPPSVTPSRATLASLRHLAENKTTLSPAVATFTDRVEHKSFACHSYKKHPGWGASASSRSFLFPSLSFPGVARDLLFPLPASLHRYFTGLHFVALFCAARIQNGQTEAVQDL